MPGSFIKLEMSRMTDKRAFFSSLEQLDCLSDGSESEFERVISSSRRKEEKVSSPGSCQNGNVSPSPRSGLNSEPCLGETITHSLSSTSSLASVIEVSNPEPSHRDMGTAGKRAVDIAKGKRKRGTLERVIPEQKQIFKGLVFFFFPNSDVSPLRRLRIQRAQDYGAHWAKTWGDNITHVIVDKGLKFEEILKHLQLGAVPPEVAVVDEGYPAACIDFRSILSVTQVRFRVKGAPSSEAQELPNSPPKNSSVADPGSLPLKPHHQEQLQTQRSPVLSDSQENIELGHPAQLNYQEELTEEIIRDSFADKQPDALDKMIEEVKATKDLPLDPLDLADDYSDDATIDSSDDEISDGSRVMQTGSKRRKPSCDEQSAAETWQQKFACMQKHDSTSNSQNPNARTIYVLRLMLEYYTRTADHWRILAYRKAISALSKQSKKVITRAEALAIPGVGTRLADKIEEIVVTDRLRRLDNTNDTAEDRLLQTFLGIYGAGFATASRWIAQGYKTLDDLRANASLTQSQRVGVDHYFDFSQRIPRSEVQAHGDIVRRVVQKESPGMQVINGGSYRRGAANSGDIDLIITRHDATIEEIRTLMLDTVVPKLFQQGFLQVGLATTSRGDGSKWHGASKLPDVQLWRRIDLLFVPGAELGAAMIYFTGNDIFNRSMRLLASKKSMRLNQRGLYADVMRGPQRTKINTGRLLEGRDERLIFEILGVPWRPREHRIC